MQRGILYAPDYLVNAGGAIANASDRPDMIADKMKTRIARIGDILTIVLFLSKADGLASEVIADHMVEERIAAASLSCSA
jgi:glutamate dehydrogenase/leucine dehydrogenase